MKLWIAGAGVMALLAVGSIPAMAAKPKTEAQAYAAQVKASMVKKFKNTSGLSGLKIGKVVCVLPKNGVTFHCTAHTSSAAQHENVVFQVAATLHDNDAMTVSWVMTSHTCTDSRTGKKLAC
jgi:hypothetical protein